MSPPAFSELDTSGGDSSSELVAGEYEAATVHEKKMPINIGRSAFLE
jgi:hypothetical protein